MPTDCSFQDKRSFFVFISRISHNFSVFEFHMRFKLFQKGNQGRRIRRTLIYGNSAIFGIDSMLNVICGFQLTVAHGILFHSHKSSVVVRFGKAVALAANTYLFRIFLQLSKYFSRVSTERCNSVFLFPFPCTNSIFSSRFIAYSFFRNFLRCFIFNLIVVYQLDAVLFFTFRY